MGASPNSSDFYGAGLEYYYYENYFWPQLIRFVLLYLVFLFVNFMVVPRLLARKTVWLYVLLLLLALVAVGLFTGILDTYTKAYLFSEYSNENKAYDAFFQQGFHYAFWLLLMLIFYTAIKYTGLYLLSHSGEIQSRSRIITRDTLSAFVIWMVSVFLLLVLNMGEEIPIVWGTVSLSAILLYSVAYYVLIPKTFTKKKPFLFYLLQVAGVLVLAFLPVAFILFPLTQNPDFAFALSSVNSLVQFFIVAPATWLLYKRQLRGNQEMHVLKEQLGTTNANLDFLRSQINPHFLFNALNTLYGTALQENSERTAQGIQMLGDMMRFMLHENHQQKILLSRETDYLRNYIDLQLLRTSVSPNITIDTRIEEVLDDKMIAPMLLIPFVENAFKHGISLKNRSWIRVTLHSQQNTLFFDVYNSKHPKSEQDTEKDKSGIGLLNVKQRLNLLYPNRHELVIRETAEEFFVHLTLQL
ncbi:histidine kinase [Pontibacter sp. Tf4]|nr:histidine kinase [Pontibacter sp. Tf4]